MTDYIKRSDAIHAVLHNEGQAAVAAVQEIKAEDVVPVVHGEWIQMNGHRYCNVCGHKDSPILTKYCPNCGAKMDGKEKGDE